MSPQTEALTAIRDALRRAVRHLFDAEVELSEALVAQSKADALQSSDLTARSPIV